MVSGALISGTYLKSKRDIFDVKRGIGRITASFHGLASVLATKIRDKEQERKRKKQEKKRHTDR